MNAKSPNTAKNLSLYLGNAAELERRTAALDALAAKHTPGRGGRSRLVQAIADGKFMLVPTVSMVNEK